jgi:hypothetical protein
MPNAIKYSTTGDTLSLKEGNIFFGVGDVGKGPSSATTYYNGVTPPSGGYTVYSFNASQTSKLSFFTAVNDASLITYTNGVSGQNFTTATQCLNWYPTQTNFACVNRDYESIVTSGLTLCLDAGFRPSYSTSGVTWYDISYGGNNGTLTNGPTFDSSNVGIILFDGVNEYVNWNNNPISTLTTSITYDAWIKFSGTVQNAFTLSSSNFKVYHQNDSTWYITGTGTGNRNISWTYITDWVNFVYSFDGTNHICYINGVSYTVNSGGGLSSQSNLQLCGRNSGDSPLKGNMAITRVYNRALSATEILQNYNAQKSRFIASFDADAQAFITAAGITDSTQQNAINTLVVGLKTDGLWTKLYAIYPIVGGTATNHKYNLKDPRDLDVAYRLVFNGGMTHSSNGILFNGTNGWADTSAINTINVFGCYTRNTSDNSLDYMGTQDSYYTDDPEGPFWTLYKGYQVAYSTYMISNLYNFSSTNNTIRTGLSSVNVDGLNQKFYKNGVLKNTSSLQPVTAPSITMGIGALNPNSNTQGGTGGIEGYSNQQIAFAFMGDSSLTSTDNSNLYTRVQAFQTSLGRQV